MAGGMYTIRFVFIYILPNMIICSILLPVVGFILGGCAAFILRRPIREVKTISLETGIQNIAIAAGVIRLTYPYPDANMVSSTVMWTMLGQFFAVTIMMVSYSIYKRCFKKSKPDAIEMEEIYSDPTSSAKKGVNDKPTIVHEIDTGDSSQFQSVHTHLARITQPKTPEYEQLPQTEPETSQPDAPSPDANGDVTRKAGYLRLLSSESAAGQPVRPGEEGGPDDGDRIDGSGADGLWELNPGAGNIDYKVFKDEED